MEILLLGKNFENIGIVQNFDEMTWTRRYYDCGEVVIKTSAQEYPVLSKAEYIIRTGSDELIIADGLTIDGENCILKGFAAKSMLDLRVLYPTVVLNGYVEVILASAVKELLDIDSVPIINREPIGGSISSQVTGGTLLDLAGKLLYEQKISFDIRLDSSDRMEFFLWQGKNLSENQTRNPFVIFSKDWETISDFSLERSEREYRNTAIVAGMGTGSDRIYTTISIAKPGEQIRELWVDARDLQADENTSESQYIQTLKKRGLAKLMIHNKTEVFQAVVEQDNFIYKTDYDLGDVVTVKTDLDGLQFTARIVGVDEIFENGIKDIVLHFGEIELA